VLFGLPTAVFVVQGSDVTVNPDARLAGCSVTSTKRTLAKFAEVAAAKLRLEVRWVSKGLG
jgi:hypothetical protein